jgi:alginate O-acetyltransferase complex protein AlgI
MLFSTLIFLYSFLPAVLILYYLFSKEYRNKLLLVSSILFFAWGGVSFTVLLFFSLIVNYISGILIDKSSGTPKAKLYLTIGIIINLLLLGIFKYAGFVVENINYVFGLFTEYKVNDPGIILPLGISFYTFQAMSYIIDVYRKEATVQKNFYKLSLYISFFPQLIAGPIVRYQNIAEQLTFRKENWVNITYGIERFTIGLSKKVLLANQFAIVADNVFELNLNELNSSTAWIGILAYTFQIYFDFSGYSDMAIGIGRMFGFKLPENFNFPYISRSIREFWQRWHMTLSIWFKNYLYFPLGGSRKGESRTIVNLLIVFFATSIWHGASWNFVIWGMSHGFFMMLERLGLGKIIDKLWRPFQHFYALLIIVVSRVFFRSDTIEHAWPFFKKLFIFDFSQVHVSTLPLINSGIFLILTIIAILASTPLFITLRNKLKSYSKNWGAKNEMKFNIAAQYLSVILVALGLILSSIFLAAGSYNPFIYFRF